MVSTSEIIKVLQNFKRSSSQKYGIRMLGIFGSFARNQQDEQSDLDVFVMLKESDYFTLERIKEDLERQIRVAKIDIVSFSESLRDSLKKKHTEGCDLYLMNYKSLYSPTTSKHGHSFIGSRS